MSSKLQKAALQLDIFTMGVFPHALTGGAAIGHYKYLLQTAQDLMDEKFREDFDITSLIHGRAWLIDQILNHAWNQFDWSGRPKISLVAVGGYGRGELHPYSDIDLLLLYKGNSPRKHEDNIRAFLTMLWDIGLKIGHSVRSIRECRSEAKSDITIATSIMEARTIAGDTALLETMKEKTGPNKIWPNEAFFAAKLAERRERHKKFNDTEYNLEPNIKSSPGGLRDIQIIGWVAKRHFGGERLQDLMAHNFLTEAEYENLHNCRTFLWKLRYGLHMITGRPEDRLLFDHQKQLAEIFGYKDEENSLAIEQLMKKCFLSIMNVLELSDVLLQHFDEVILQANQKTQVKPVNSRFNVVNDYIEASSPQVFIRSPFALMEIFQLMAYDRSIKGVRASTIRLIRSHRNLINDEFRNDIRITSLFMDMMRAPSGVVTQLHRMRRYGILGRYLPEFGKIIGQMQHDLFHIYTVDAHTLMLLQYVRRIYLGEALTEFPIAAEVIRKLPKIELLFIGCLYHDIAKGRGGDHSELGAVDALAFGERHRLPDWDKELVAWMVEHHLHMSMIAQRMDISDPLVVKDFAEMVGDQTHLDYLFALTIADINATNPTLWNSWRASLLRQLYFETTEVLDRGLSSPVAIPERVQESQRDAKALLTQEDSAAVDKLWGLLDDDYFSFHKAEDIAYHTRTILAHGDADTTLVHIRETGDMNVSEILIFNHQGKPSDFAVTTSVLEKLRLNVMDARVSAAFEDIALSTYIVLDEDGNSVGDNVERVGQIRQTLQEALDAPEQTVFTLSQHTSRRMQHFSTPTEVTTEQDATYGMTAFKVVAPDRPGLLALISHILLDHNLLIQKAKIATLGEKVEDVFFVTDQEGNPVKNSSLCKQVENTICSELDNWIQSDNQNAPQSITL